jgi:hypothetical protein
MAVEIPLPQSTPHFRQRTQLDGVSYHLEFNWNGRQALWYLSIFDEALTPLLQGVALTMQRPLLARGNSTALPPGVLMLIDSGLGTAVEEATLEDLGVRCRLIYVTAAEVAAAAAP